MILNLLNKQATGEHLLVPGLLIFFPFAFVCNKLIQQLRWHRFYLRSISWFIWLIAMLLSVKIQLFSDLQWLDVAWLQALPQSITQLLYTFRPELLILVSSAVLWWLGRRLSFRRMNFVTLVTEFQFGLVILLITILIASALEVDLTGSVLLTLVFFFFALLGISIAHAQEGTTWLSDIHKGHWSWLLLVSIGLILIVGLLIGTVVSPELLQAVVAALKWIWGWIVKAIAFIASLFPAPEPGEMPLLPAPEPGIQPDEGFKLWTIPESLRRGLNIAMGILWIGLILVALWQVSSQIYKWLRRRLAGMAGAEVEPLPGAFRADFLAFIRHIFHKLLEFKVLFGLVRKSGYVLPEIASVRQIYRQILRWGKAGGCPRQASQTPNDYLCMLVELAPAVSGDLHFITRHYVRARYGTSVPTADELHRLQQSWHRVKQSPLKRSDK